ncbi:DMT family transporter [Desulfobacter hydrogenophilus]|nr:DMT family transporter [Desulfobacter hydrogenophilus]NDY72647.1 DMT family transporter [Desulfobacter hydrogenophilus]QBH14534.1 DMT family transporter [Desulfobacter hydrogenophilus]
MTVSVSRPVAGIFWGAIIISFSSVMVTLSHVNPIISAFYRVFWGCLFLLIPCGLNNEFKQIDLKPCLGAVGCGFFFAVDLISWHFCIEYVGPGLATILGNLQVFIMALVGAFLFKERLGTAYMIALTLAILGLYMIIGMDMAQLTPEYLTGVGLGVITALSYSVFLLLMRMVHSGDDVPMFIYQVIVTGVCALIIGSIAVFMGRSFIIPDFSSLAALVCLGLLSQGLAWVIISHYLPRVDTSRAGLILLLQPALSFVWDVVFFDRLTGMMGWLGVSIVLSAIYMGMMRRA